MSDNQEFNESEFQDQMHAFLSVLMPSLRLPTASFRHHRTQGKWQPA